MSHKIEKVLLQTLLVCKVFKPLFSRRKRNSQIIAFEPYFRQLALPVLLLARRSLLSFPLNLLSNPLTQPPKFPLKHPI